MPEQIFLPNDFEIEDLVRRATAAEFTFEYNCDMRRIYPWDEVANTKRPVTEFGLVWVQVRPHTNVDRHEHDEEETFLVLAGRAELELEGQTTELGAGDVVYIPRFWAHQMRNPFDELLVFADIYWDFKGRTKEAVLGEAHGAA